MEPEVLLVLHFLMLSRSSSFRPALSTLPLLTCFRCGVVLSARPPQSHPPTYPSNERRSTNRVPERPVSHPVDRRHFVLASGASRTQAPRRPRPPPSWPASRAPPPLFELSPPCACRRALRSRAAALLRRRRCCLLFVVTIKAFVVHHEHIHHIRQAFLRHISQCAANTIPAVVRLALPPPTRSGANIRNAAFGLLPQFLVRTR